MSEDVVFEFESEEIGIGEEGLSPFQQEFINEIQDHSGQHKFIFMDAPTGAGKTYSFTLPILVADIRSTGFKPHILISEPTREIIRELKRDIPRYVEKYKETYPSEKKNVSVTTITGETPVTEGGRQLQIYSAVLNNDVVIMTPDILSLYIAGNYVWGNNEYALRKSTNFQDPLSLLSVIVFDEYHTYDPESLGKILSIATIAVKAKFPMLRFVFSSATPSEKFKKILEDVTKDIAPDSIKSITATPSKEKGKGRKLRGHMKLVVTTKDISSTIDEVQAFLEARGNGKMLYIFNSILESERFGDLLIKNDITPRIVNGFHDSQVDFNERIIVATSAVELGVNIGNVELGHIEPGYYFENLSQRLGRFSRQDQDSTVYLHVGEEWLNEFRSIKTNNYYDFLKKVSEIVQPKHIQETAVRNNARVFTYCVYKNTHREGLRDHIMESLLVLGGGKLLDVDRALHVVEKCDGDYGDKTHFLRWWHDYFRAYGYFRGAISNVKVRLPKGIQTEYDYVWILRHAEFTTEGDTFVINNWREIPKKPLLKYTGFLSGDSVLFEWDEIQKNDGNRKFRDRWYSALKKALGDLDLSDEQRDECYTILKEALYTIHQGLLPVDKSISSGVDRNELNIFI